MSKACILKLEGDLIKVMRTFFTLTVRELKVSLQAQKVFLQVENLSKPWQMSQQQLQEDLKEVELSEKKLASEPVKKRVLSDEEVSLFLSTLSSSPYFQLTCEYQLQQVTKAEKYLKRMQTELAELQEKKMGKNKFS